MLKIIHIGNGLPASFPVDLTSTFQPGMVGQLTIIGNDIVLGVSDGTAPIGMIDDIRSSAFTQTVYDEIVIIPGRDVFTDGYNFFNGKDTIQTLANAGIIQSSFLADYEGLVLNPVNGVLTLPEDSQLNWDADGDLKNDSVKTIVNYVYTVPSISGDDTTMGSGRITLWYSRGIYATDQYDPTQRYPLNATLFVGLDGKFTTKQWTAQSVGVALITAPPSAIQSMIELMWL